MWQLVRFLAICIVCCESWTAWGLTELSQVALSWQAVPDWQNSSRGLADSDANSSLATAPVPLHQPASRVAPRTQGRLERDVIVTTPGVAGKTNRRSNVAHWASLSASWLAMLQEVPQEEAHGYAEVHTSRELDGYLFLPFLGCFCVFVVSSINDIKLLCGLTTKDIATVGSSIEKDDHAWSIRHLVCLTSYRFYTGFLSATWLPFLLAREGEDLWAGNQSLFMGSAKLVYGLTILLNPVFGRLGDQLATLSHGVGRRFFLRIGIMVAALGIFLCIAASRVNAFWPFMAGITLWRFGESLNDVTTEALVPELVPQSQWQAGSSVKSALFLAGGLFGYVLLLLMPSVHYSWLYYAYLFSMFTLVIPPLLLLSNDAPRGVGQQKGGQGFIESMADAYIEPVNYEGGFPLACLAVFLFSLGTTPVFFLLLFVRDLVGISGVVAQQKYFCGASLVFFISAALAAVISGKVDSVDAAGLSKRPQRLVASMFVCGVATAVLPGVGYLPTMWMRLSLFFALSVVYGLSFGSAFTRFQDCTWQIMPTGVNLANAMGFNVMSRLFGVGLGNFLAGIILDGFDIEGTARYKKTGYVAMCLYSATCVFVSCSITNRALAAPSATARSVPENAAAG